MVGNASRVAWESFSSMTICCVLASPEGNGGEIVDVEVGRGVDLALCEGGLESRSWYVLGAVLPGSTFPACVLSIQHEYASVNGDQAPSPESRCRHPCHRFTLSAVSCAPSQGLIVESKHQPRRPCHRHDAARPAREVQSRPIKNDLIPPMKLANKTALVTGASQGIGLACAQRLVREGARVMLADVRPEGAAAAAALGDAARFFCADVSQKSDVDALFAATIEAFGQIDILVNNAGVTHAADFLDLLEEDFDRVLRINLKSMFLCSQAAARDMVKRNSGCIINMSSVNAELVIPNQVPYVVSKGGVNQLTRVAAISLAQHGIRVNAIGPGTILTELARQAVLGSPEARHTILSRTPLGRCGEPEEVAAIAAFLASDDASYITGQTLYADGGRMPLNYTVAVRD